MIDAIVRSSRDPRQRQGSLSRTGVSSAYPRSQPRTNPVIAPVQVVAPVPMKPDILPPPQAVAIQPVTVVTEERYSNGSGFADVEVDEVFSRIAALEAESPIAPSIGSPMTGAAAATLVQTPALPNTIVLRQHPVRRRRLSDRLWYGGSIFLVIGVLSVTGYVSIDTWLTNREVKQVVAEKQQASTQQSMVLGEGEDETQVAPSAIDSYSVAADLPRVLSIDSLKIKARILPMSVNADGAMQAPVNIFDSGWYSASAKPGIPGATLIDAHASGATRQGLFAYLDTLKIGETLSLERGDGQKFNYAVTHVETVPLKEVDMAKVLKPYGAAEEGLNLITCTGTWIPDQKTYDHRVIVYTKRV